MPMILELAQKMMWSELPPFDNTEAEAAAEQDNLGATRQQLNFFSRSAGRSCRSYPLWDRHLWHPSIRRALSTPRRNHRGSIRFYVLIDAAVDVTYALNEHPPRWGS